MLREATALRHGVHDGRPPGASGRWTGRESWEQGLAPAAGVQKRLGITVTAAERVRQVGPGRKGTRGSYTVYRITDTG